MITSTHTTRNRRIRRQSGFTMIELTIVLAVISVVLAGILPFIASTNQENAATTTLERIEEIDAALASFVAANDRLPCPANLVLPLDDPDFGREAAAGGTPNCTGGTPAADYDFNNIVGGAVPVKDIGLSDEYAFDGYGQRISYHVHSDYTLAIDPTTPPTAPIIEVEDEMGNLRTDEAVYLLLSHGTKGHGAYLRSGARKNLGATNPDELENCDCDATAVDTGYNALFVQRPSAISDDPAVHHDDIVRYKLYNQVRGAAATAEGAGTPLWVPNGNNIYAVGTDGDEATGNVGIGTTAPAAPLDITALTGSGGFMRVDPDDGGIELGSGNDSHSYIDFRGDANLGTPVQGRILHDDDFGMFFHTNATPGNPDNAGHNPQLTILNNGYVGIGTDNPAQAFSVINDAGGNHDDDDISIYSYESTSSAHAPAFISWRARGTEASPGAVQAGDKLAGFAGYGWSGSSFARGGVIEIYTEQNWTPTASTQDAFMQFKVARDGVTPEAMRITSDGHVGINNTAPSAELRVDGDIHFTGVFADVSDARYKEHIAPLNPAEMLERVTQIRNVRFTMKDDPEERTEFGVIAQELEAIFPELVNTSDNAEGTKTVAYSGLIAPMIAAIQEQQRRIESLEAELASVSPSETVDAQSNLSGLSINGLATLTGGLLLIVLAQGAVLALLWRRVTAGPRMPSHGGLYGQNS